MKVTAAQLKRIVGGAAPLAAEAADAFTKHSDEFEINTPLRAAHFWSQVGHESRLRYVAEIWGPTEAQRGYEGRADLGNTVPGDGKRFMGHSLIQVTGRANHRDFTIWLRKRSPNCPDFEANPEKLQEFPWAMMGAFWFWTTRKLNALADKDQGKAITKRVNGGYNGLKDRMAILERAKEEFGVEPKLLPRVTKVVPEQWNGKLLPAYEVRAIQQQLIDKGFHKVGLVDGIWGDATTLSIEMLQAVGAKLDPTIRVDGLYGPQTKNLLADPTIVAEVSEERASITVKDLANKGNPAVLAGKGITTSSVWSFIMAVGAFAVAVVQGWEAQPDVPWYGNLLMGFLPPGAAPLAIALFNIYNIAKAQGLIGAAVERVKQGIDNSGAPPKDMPFLPWPFNMIGGK